MVKSKISISLGEKSLKAVGVRSVGDRDRSYMVDQFAQRYVEICRHERPVSLSDAEWEFLRRKVPATTLDGAAHLIPGLLISIVTAATNDGGTNVDLKKLSAKLLSLTYAQAVAVWDDIARSQ